MSIISTIPPAPPPYMQEVEVAKILGVAKKTLGQWRAQGIGPSWCKPARRVLYNTIDLFEWIEASKEIPTNGDKVKERKVRVQVSGRRSTVQQSNRFGRHKTVKDKMSSDGVRSTESSNGGKGAGTKDNIYPIQ